MRTPLSALAVAVLVAAFAHGATGAQGQDDILQILIEKAREREGALDRVDVRYSGTAVAMEALVPIAVTFKGRYFISAEKSRSHAEANVKGPGIEDSRKVDILADGENVRTLFEGTGWHSGVIEKQSEGFDRGQPDPEDMAVTGLYGTPGTLSEVLEADTAKLSAKYGERFTAPDAVMQTSVRGRQTVGGRECVVVECYADPRDGSPETIHRLFFAEDLNYACVKFEAGHPSPERLQLSFSATLGDFREAKEGIFVPFAVIAKAFSQDGQIRATIKCDVESLEFPETFDENAFTLVFADGIEVWDKIAGVNYIGGGASPDHTVEDMLLAMAEEVTTAEETRPAPVVEAP